MARGKKDYGKVDCPVCGRSFIKHDHRQIYCCMNCSSRAESERAKRRWEIIKGARKEVNQDEHVKEYHQRAEETKRKNKVDVFNKVRSVDWGREW